MFSHIFILQKNDKNSYHTEVQRAQIIALHKNRLPQRQKPRKTTFRDDTSMKHAVAQSPTSFVRKSDSICFLKVLMLVLVQFHVDSVRNLT